MLWLLLPSIGSSASQSDTQLLNKANDLIRQHRADEAYKMLLPLESSKAGEPAYDYMLGISAMESGDISNAVFALQRAVAVKPDFVGAKMDLARSYYKLEEMKEAKQEFQSIFQYNPSTRLQEIINLYLSNINMKQRKHVRKTTKNISMNVTAGYDSNSNSAPTIDNYLGIDLDDNSRRKPSNYVGTSANLSFISSLSKKKIVTYSMGYSQRDNFNTRFVNNMSIVAGSGYIQKLSAGQLVVNAQLFQAYVTGNYSGRNMAGIAQYSSKPKDGQSLGLMTNVSMFRANPEGSIRDANQFILGVNFNSTSNKTTTPNSVISFSAGKAETVDPDSPYGKNFSSVRLALNKKVKFKIPLMLKATASVTNTAYSGTFNGVNRRERLNAIDFSADMPVRKNMNLVIGGLYSSSKSSIELYTFNRYEFKTVLKWLFR